MAHVVEPATSARASCRGCGARIAAGTLRFGERLPNPFTDDETEMTHWFHLPCGAFRRPEPFLEVVASLAEPLPDHAVLVGEAELGRAHRRLPRLTTASRAPTGRARCRHCREPIARDTWRVSLVYHEDGRFVPSGYLHAACVAGYVDTRDVMPRITHFSPDLTAAELAEVEAAATQT